VHRPRPQSRGGRLQYRHAIPHQVRVCGGVDRVTVMVVISGGGLKIGWFKMFQTRIRMKIRSIFSPRFLKDLVEFPHINSMVHNDGFVGR